MTDLADTQDKILLHLKQRGPQTAKSLATAFGITTMGIRQHLAALADKGLVLEGEEQKLGRGRPVRPWLLTEAAQKRFPDAHSLVSVELIDAVRESFGEAGLDQLIERRTERVREQYQQALDKFSSLSGKINKLAEIRSQEGYMAEVEKLDSKRWLLLENHCPICVAATSCQGFCRSELEVFESVFSGIASVKREEHILKGARRCAYLIEKM